MFLGLGGSVVAVDRQPLYTWMTEYNARVVEADVRTEVADVTTLDMTDCFVHIDPSRRAGGRRRWRFEDYEPGPEYLHDLCARAKACAIKLGPGIDATALPDGEVEFIAERGQLVQAVLWSNELARCKRSATRLPEGVTFSGVPQELHRTSHGEFRKFLYVADVALERAGLVGAHPQADQLEEPAPGLGLWTSDAELDDWFTGFAVEEVMPWRIGPVTAWLRQRGAGQGGREDSRRRRRSGEGEAPAERQRRRAIRGIRATAWEGVEGGGYAAEGGGVGECKLLGRRAGLARSCWLR